MELQAYDEAGNTFKKHAVVTETVVSFGWPVEYHRESLMRHYPFKQPLCIDIGGRLHKGFPTYVTADDVNALLDPRAK